MNSTAGGEPGARTCVFFDRDGIVNESPGPGYVERWEDFRLTADFPDALRTVLRLGCVAVIVTNQRGVALGRMSLRDVDRIHSNLRALLRERHGLDVLDIFCCPHERGQCACRKPLPGMLLDAARRHDIDLTSSWMVGDGETDVQAGHAAGCRTVRVCAGDEPTSADYRVNTLRELPPLLERLLAARPKEGDER